MIIAPDQLPILRERAGRGLVLVAGVFDPLHVGHLAYFDKARAFGPLVCAVASDAYIRRVKQRPPLLPQADRMALLDRFCDYVIAQDETGEAGVLEDVRPETYAKGIDWLDKLPDAETTACHQFGIPAVFLEGARVDSSTARLKAYQRELDETAVARFEAFVAQQVPAATPWTPVTDYSFEARKAIEGIHPQLIKDVFRPREVLNVGCASGALDGLLRDGSISVEGMDLHPPHGPHFWTQDVCDARPISEWAIPFIEYDLVICREVLEHLTVLQVVKAVRNLVNLSSKYVYVTTRFHPDPDHVLAVADHDDLDPTHITLLNKAFLRALFVLEGCKSRPDLESLMDWQSKGRCLVFEVA